MKFRKYGLLLAMFVMSLAFAVSSPLNMLKTTSSNLLNELEAKHANLQTNPVLAYDIVRRLLLPHVDVQSMSRSALGREVWFKANAQQRKNFTREFTTLLIHTYASALANYSGETVKFFPLRGSIEGRTRVQVDSVIFQPNGPNIPVSYRVILRGNQWKVYDITVDGVSLLQNFRSQFAAELSQYNLNHVIERLKEHNASFENR